MKNLNLKMIVGAVVAVAVMAAAAPEAVAQKKPAELSVGIYAPSAAFPTSAARLSYVQGMAKAIEQKTGIPTKGQAFVRYTNLLKAKPDFAIIEGLCVVTKRPGEVVAMAAIEGQTTMGWGLYTRSAKTLREVEGKDLAYVQTGCRDKEFVENAMLDGEVKQQFFGKLVARPDVSGAVAAVKDYKAAEAVFAPHGQAKGLNKLFDTGSMPTPAFVVMNEALPADVVGDVKATVLGYGAGGVIGGWRAASEQSYAGLNGQLRVRTKEPVFAMPDVVRLDVGDILMVPELKYDQVTVSQHFWEPK